MKQMELQGGRDKAEQAAFFAKSVHRIWGMESSDCDNGVVLFLSKDDHEV